MQDKAKELYISSVEPWAVNIKKISEDLENAIAADNRGKIRQSFQRYSTEASQRFFKFDDQLNTFCGDLLDIDGPLASVLRMMNE